MQTTAPSPAPRRKRAHPARRARLVTGVASVAATLGLSGFLAASYAAPTTTVAAAATSTVAAQTSQAITRSTVTAATPAAATSRAQTSSSGS